MHEEILNTAQRELLPLMKRFAREYYLVGGTAIALQIGHRRSIDFDMFKQSAINHKKTLDKITEAGFETLVTRRVFEQMNLLVNDVKLTFFQYPFPVVAEEKFKDIFRMPSLLSLAAMKAYALGRRSKWKDYRRYQDHAYSPVHRWGLASRRRDKSAASCSRLIVSILSLFDYMAIANSIAFPHLNVPSLLYVPVE